MLQISFYAKALPHLEMKFIGSYACKASRKIHKLNRLLTFAWALKALIPAHCSHWRQPWKYMLFLVKPLWFHEGTENYLKHKLFKYNFSHKSSKLSQNMYGI